MRNSKEVENYWVEIYPNGIVHLLFNTKNRWVNFHRYNDEMFRIGGNPDADDEGWIQEIPEGLIPQDGRYLPLTLQEKDQISFYYVPIEMIGMDGKMIYNSKDK